MILLGVDTGGTFTDFVLWRESQLRVHKILSTPQAPEQAIWQGIVALRLETEVARGEVLLIHGTTVATNAALEGKGVKTVFITNRGFADMLTLGRQARPKLYQLQSEPMLVPVPEEFCLEIDCRVDAKGDVVTALQHQDLERLRQDVEQISPDAIAINLLFSYLNPDHEIAIAQALQADCFVCRSSEILPEYKEYERGIATWLNAYLGPLMQGYLQQLQINVAQSKIAVMQSSGGTIAAEIASHKAVNLLLSGPAGGLAAVRFLGETAQLGGLMTFDMGGTSTDVALVDGDLVITSEGHIGPYPVAVPMVDMHTIGAGGGSIAAMDEGGLLQVGPQSAGADPGPACYGKGGKQATVTDANLVLGRLPANNPLGGSLVLDKMAAFDVVNPLAAALDLSVEATAAGIIDIANERMAQALRVISVQRGHDPKDFMLCSFGGAGGLHVCDLATRLGMRRAVVPIHNGVLSALGLLVAPRERQLSRSVQAKLNSLDSNWIAQVFEQLKHQGVVELMAEGVAEKDIQTQANVDLRYLGQSAHLSIAFQSLEQCKTDFETAHHQRYSHTLDTSVELVTLRQRVFAQTNQLQLPELIGDKIPIADCSDKFPIYQRDQLSAGVELEGPVLVCEQTATIFLEKNWRLRVDKFGNLLLNRVC